MPLDDHERKRLLAEESARRRMRHEINLAEAQFSVGRGIAWGCFWLSAGAVLVVLVASGVIHVQ